MMKEHEGRESQLGPSPGPTDAELRSILSKYHRVAVVGLSPNPERPSYEIAEYLISQGYDIIGVNPKVSGQVLERPCYPTIGEIPVSVEIVDVFREPEAVPGIVDELLALNPAARPKVLWLQEGITSPEAENRAREAGMIVVSDHCMFKEHSRLFGAG